MMSLVSLFGYAVVLWVACPNITGTLTWHDWLIALAVGGYGELRRASVSRRSSVSGIKWKAPMRLDLVKVDGQVVWQRDMTVTLAKPAKLEVEWWTKPGDC